MRPDALQSNIPKLRYMIKVHRLTDVESKPLVELLDKFKCDNYKNCHFKIKTYSKMNFRRLYLQSTLTLIRFDTLGGIPFDAMQR